LAGDLWDADSTVSNDDELIGPYRQTINWGDSLIVLTKPDNTVSKSWTIIDNSSIPQCSNSGGPINMCFRTKPTELAPGQQF
jgi:hypothetical protein